MDKYSKDYYREQGKVGYEKGLKPWKDKKTPEEWTQFYVEREKKRQEALKRKKENVDKTNNPLI